MLKKYLIFLLGMGVIATASASLQVRVDKNNLANDEMLTLQISSSDHMSITPDLSSLKRDFYIVGTSQNSQFNIINGVTKMETEWQVALLPKHAGDIMIPAIEAGNEKTEPVLIHVVPVKKSISQAQTDSGVFIEANLIPKEIFIQEQLVYTLKLFFSRTIENPYLMPPDLADAKITQNGQDIIYTAVKNGKYYRVLERSYLITPKSTGVFVIDPPVLKGYIEGSLDNTDPYGFSTRSLKQIKVVGPTLEVKVKPKPASFSGQWLPAKKLKLSETWTPNPSKFREGEPISRIIEVSAEGTTGEQIPNFNIHSATNFNSYPEQPQRETTTNGDVQVGKMKQKIIFIPTASGQITLPAIQLHWWNSATGKEEVAVLPERTITVLPSAIKPIQPKQNLNANQNTSNNLKQAISTQPEKSMTMNSPSKNSFWPILASIIALAWLVTLFMWRRQLKLSGKKIGVGKPKFNLNEALSQLREASFASNPKKARRYLLEWAVLHWKNTNIHSLTDIVHILEGDHAEGFIKEIMQLEASFYSKNKKDWHGAPFWYAFQAYLRTNEPSNHNKTSDPLPPLYISS